MAKNEETEKRPSRLAAFALNFLFPPAGYVYAGHTKTAIFAMAILIAASAAGYLASIAFPPGWFAAVSDKGASPIVAVPLLALGAHAAWLAIRPNKSLSGFKFWLALLGLPILFVGFSLAWRAYCPISNYIVPSHSGLPTIAVGDQIAVHGARGLCGLAKPAPGNLIVYRHGPTIYLKRVIAGPGDLIMLKGGKLSLNGAWVKTRAVGSAPIDPSSPISPVGQVIEETLPNGIIYQTLVTAQMPELDNFGPYKVPPKSWFVMGDNRDDSLDSRADGPVGQDRVCGTVFKILNSSIRSHIGSSLESLPHP